MNANSVEAKVERVQAGAMRLLLRAGDVVLQTEHEELSQCDFPIWSSAPVPVEIPPSGAKDYQVGPFHGEVTQRAADGSYPHVIKFPVYRAQEIVGAEAFERLKGADGGATLSKVPILALATELSGRLGGRWVQAHCVLPVWADGSAVLVTLDWQEGESAEGTPNPEYHLRSSTGLPLALGLQHLARASRMAGEPQDCRCHLFVSPWRLGARLLGDEGAASSHRVWQRQWEFEGQDALAAALGRITDGLLGTGPAGGRGAA